MKSQRKIGVKFCGSCNPQIDTKEMYLEINRMLTDAELVPWNEAEGTDLLVICGCPVNCAQRPNGILKEVTIAGKTVNYSPCDVDNIPHEAVRYLRDNVKKTEA